MNEQIKDMNEDYIQFFQLFKLSLGLEKVFEKIALPSAVMKIIIFLKNVIQKYLGGGVVNNKP